MGWNAPLGQDRRYRSQSRNHAAAASCSGVMRRCQAATDPAGRIRWAPMRGGRPDEASGRWARPTPLPAFYGRADLTSRSRIRASASAICSGVMRLAMKIEILPSCATSLSDAARARTTEPAFTRTAARPR